MSGFISIERGLWDHPFFQDGPMTEREAWMWMLARAAWKPTQHRVGGAMVDVPRGSFMCTLRELQRAFGWKSDKRVRTFLKSLEGEDMIGRTTVGRANAPKTHVTICEYDKYQKSGRTKDAPKTHGGRTKDAVKEQGNNKQSNPNGLQPDGVPDQVWNDFKDHRKRKKADITPTAMSGIENQATKAGWTMTDALAEIVTRGWIGFNAEWVEKRVAPQAGRPTRSPHEWLTFCEEQVIKWRKAGKVSFIEEWEAKAREARSKLPALQVVK